MNSTSRAAVARRRRVHATTDNGDTGYLADEITADEAYEREQVYWASPEGVERQLAEFRAEREKWGGVRD